GDWSADDFDVAADGDALGRIFNANAAPVGSPWMWTLIFPHHEDRTPTHGYTGTRRAPSVENRSVRYGVAGFQTLASYGVAAGGDTVRCSGACSVRYPVVGIPRTSIARVQSRAVATSPCVSRAVVCAAICASADTCNARRS